MTIRQKNRVLLVGLGMHLLLLSPTIGQATEGGCTIEEWQAFARLLEGEEAGLASRGRSIDATDMLGAEDFIVSPNLGRRLSEDEWPTDIPDQYDVAAVYRLGGEAMGEVFRVVQKDGEAYVIKKFGVDVFRDSDLRSIEFIRNRLMDPDPRFGAVQALEGPSSTTLILDDVVGVPLSQLKGRVSAEKYSKIYGNYLEMLQMIANNAFTNISGATFLVEPTFGSGDLMMKILFKGKEYNILLKPDNVVVDSRTGKIIIIDPM